MSSPVSQDGPAGTNDVREDDEAAYARYVATLNDLLNDALDRRNARMLALALNWTLARIAVRCGPRATGDILARLGETMIEVHDRDEAQREAERERAAGRMPH